MTLDKFRRYGHNDAFASHHVPVPDSERREMARRARRVAKNRLRFERIRMTPLGEQDEEREFRLKRMGEKNWQRRIRA